MVSGTKNLAAPSSPVEVDRSTSHRCRVGCRSGEFWRSTPQTGGAPEPRLLCGRAPAIMPGYGRVGGTCQSNTHVKAGPKGAEQNIAQSIAQPPRILVLMCSPGKTPTHLEKRTRSPSPSVPWSSSDPQKPTVGQSNSLKSHPGNFKPAFRQR